MNWADNLSALLIYNKAYMLIQGRSNMRIAKIPLTIFFLLSLLIPPQTARADIAPPPEIELGGVRPLQFQETKVQMEYERVEMELEVFRDESFHDPTQNRVTVNAYFIMKNQGAVVENMLVVFPLMDMSVCRGETRGDSFTSYSILDDSFKVSVDGSTTALSRVETELGFCTNYPWVAFNVTFPVDKEVLIKVSYIMETQHLDSAQNIDYVLETGAGWYGKIGKGYVILKFPYRVTPENILSDTTPGYQIQFNEVYWSFTELEPGYKDNIHISIVSPNVWQEIQRLRDQISVETASPDAWINLIDIYGSIALKDKFQFVRDNHYYELYKSSYQKAIDANPNNAQLYAEYASRKLFDFSPHAVEPITKEQASQVTSLLNKALALEPDNQDALDILSALQRVAPFVTFTPPPTIPSTMEISVTEVPSITPTITLTPPLSAKPVVVTSVVTVVHTKIVKLPTSTPIPSLTMMSSPTQLEKPVEGEKRSNTATFLFGGLFIFAAGIGAGIYLSKRK